MVRMYVFFFPIFPPKHTMRVLTEGVMTCINDFFIMSTNKKNIKKNK